MRSKDGLAGLAHPKCLKCRHMEIGEEGKKIPTESQPSLGKETARKGGTPEPCPRVGR
jgi:hypothetical protein